MEKLLALLVKAVIGGGVRLFLGWLGVSGSVAAAVVLALALCLGGWMLTRRRATRA
jgi:NhaP-type Na+/H+ or K+/H+ antiporter